MIPKYLYHYATIKSFMAIMQSQRIRFTRLDILNDPYEGLCQVGDCQNTAFARFAFCSCWSDHAEESIALWALYTRCTGVRIKANSALFGRFTAIEEIGDGYIFTTKLNHPITIPENWGLHVIRSVRGPIKMNYVPGERLGFKGIRQEKANAGTPNEHERHLINFIDIGSKKDIHWDYESEWRYLISPFPYVSTSAPLDTSASLLTKNYPEFIDIPFDVKCIEEVMTGPEMSPEDCAHLREFLKNGDIPLVTSSVKTRMYRDR